jgi:hypothetical protein
MIVAENQILAAKLGIIQKPVRRLSASLVPRAVATVRHSVRFGRRIAAVPLLRAAED